MLTELEIDAEGGLLFIGTKAMINYARDAEDPDDKVVPRWTGASTVEATSVLLLVAASLSGPTTVAVGRERGTQCPRASVRVWSGTLQFEDGFIAVGNAGDPHVVTAVDGQQSLEVWVDNPDEPEVVLVAVASGAT